jgi:ComF family protein
MPSSACGVTPNASRSAKTSTSRSRIRALVDGALAVLIAPACAACDRSLLEPTRGPVCQSCWDGIVTLQPPLCEQCGDPLPSWRIISVSEARCPRCRRRPSRITCCRAIGPYAGALRDIVHALKYGHRRSIAAELGRRMRVTCAEVLDTASVAVPVPLHRSRQRTRGFNQAAELARHLGLPCMRALKRIRATPSQTGLPAARRHANVRQAFARRRGYDVRGLCVVLVDDVSTTGATLDACARVLIEAGAREVRAVTAARVASRPLE